MPPFAVAADPWGVCLRSSHSRSASMVRFFIFRGLAPYFSAIRAFYAHAYFLHLGELVTASSSAPR